MKKLMLIFCWIALVSCDSAQSIQVIGASGEPLAGQAVTLSVIDDTGTEIQLLETFITDDSGFIRFDLSKNRAANIVLSALTTSGAMRAFAAGTYVSSTQGAVAPTFAISPITEALVSAVILVTASDGGRELADFSVDEVRSLQTAALEQLGAMDELDLTSASATLSALLTAIGRDIADAAGGSVSSTTLAGIVGTNDVSNGPTFETTATCGDDVALFTADFFVVDLTEDGQACNLEAITGPMADGLDGGMALTFIGDTFSGEAAFPGTSLNPSAPKPTVTIEDEREVVYGPVTSDAGLEVTRKVFVVEGMDVIRYLEVLENPTANDITVDLRITGEFGLDISTVLLAQNSPGVFDESSSYGAFVTTIPNPSPPRPTIGWVLDGEEPLDGIDSAAFPPQNGDVFFYSWQDVTISPGETKVFMHFFTASASQMQSDNLEVLTALYESPNMEGFNVIEINSLQNFRPSIGNVRGQAGSVVSNEDLTITRGSASVQVTAKSDGSFKAALSVASGDTVQITGTLGTAVTVSVP